MPAKFEFRDNLLELEIAGEVFKIDPAGETTLDAYAEMEKGATEREQKSQTLTNAELKEFVRDTMEFMSGCIDMMLGESATRRIFKDRTITYFDILDVIKYLRTEVYAAMQGKAQETTAQPTNRSQRRATAKKAPKKAVENEPADE